MDVLAYICLHFLGSSFMRGINSQNPLILKFYLYYYGSLRSSFNYFFELLCSSHIYSIDTVKNILLTFWKQPLALSPNDSGQNYFKFNFKVTTLLRKYHQQLSRSPFSNEAISNHSSIMYTRGIRDQNINITLQPHVNIMKSQRHAFQ